MILSILRRATSFFLLLLFLTGCCLPCQKLKFYVPCCFEGRRPQVMEERTNYTLQFDYRCPAPADYQEQNVERPCEDQTTSNYNFTCCREEEWDDRDQENVDEYGCIIEQEIGPVDDPCLDIKRPSQRRYPSKKGQCQKKCNYPYAPSQSCGPLVEPELSWPYIYPFDTREENFCCSDIEDTCTPCFTTTCCNCGCCETECCCDEELDPYRFAIGDTMAISVQDEDEASLETVTVAADGKIYYLFLDGIEADNKTIEEVTKDLTDKLKTLFSDPLVSIAPTSSLNSTFTILGRVFNPGVYPVPGRIKLREAIALAGGIYQRQFDEDSVFNSFDPLPLANLRCSFLVRDGERMSVDFQSVLFSANQSNNINVYPGDYIYIAPAYNEQVFLLGNVSRPLRIPFQRGMSLMEALTIGGGWSTGTPQSADMSRVLVIRGDLCCPCVICVNLFDVIEGIGNNFVLMPGDIIFVPNKTMRFGRELVWLAINTFVQSFANSAGSFYGQTHWFND